MYYSVALVLPHLGQPRQKGVRISQMRALAKSFKTQILLGNKVYIAIPHGTLGRVCSSGTLKNLFLFLLIIIPHRL